MRATARCKAIATEPRLRGMIQITVNLDYLNL